jgi:hypothetical protein
MSASRPNWPNSSLNTARTMPRGAKGVRHLAVMTADAILIAPIATGEIEGKRSASPPG